MTTVTELYPLSVLNGAQTALILFAAGFGGAQDAQYIADAGLSGTCVDNHPGKLRDMRENYPDDWAFIEADVFEFVAATEGMWDIVSADPWTQDFDACAAILPQLCELAHHAVVIGVGRNTVLKPPAGWRVTSRVFRSHYIPGGVWWKVVERQ